MQVLPAVCGFCQLACKRRRDWMCCSAFGWLCSSERRHVFDEGTHARLGWQLREALSCAWCAAQTWPRQVLTCLMSQAHVTSRTMCSSARTRKHKHAALLRHCMLGLQTEFKAGMLPAWLVGNTVSPLQVPLAAGQAQNMCHMGS